jgi:hypothetical protein
VLLLLRMLSRRRITRRRGGLGQPAPRIFFHIFCGPHTLPILKDQIKALLLSGLYERVSAIRCCLAGEGGAMAAVKDLLRSVGRKFEIACEAPGDASAERLTLLQLRREVRSGEKILYLHTKGVSRPGNEAVAWWRTWMEWHLLSRFADCLAALDTHDLVGCSWLVGAQNPIGGEGGVPRPVGPHFPGNFWWARGDYLQRLPEVIGAAYNDPEDWISRPANGPPPRVKDLDPGRVGPVSFLYSKPIWPRDYLPNERPENH